MWHARGAPVPVVRQCARYAPRRSADRSVCTAPRVQMTSVPTAAARGTLVFRASRRPLPRSRRASLLTLTSSSAAPCAMCP